MTKQEAWRKFDVWFEMDGHWVYGVNGKEKAELAWSTRGINHLPNYPGSRGLIRKQEAHNEQNIKIR